MVLVLDNGAGQIKAGLHNDTKPRICIANCTAKVDKSMQYLIGNEIFDIANGAMLHTMRPFDRGYLTNWQCEIEVWNHLFEKLLPTDPSVTSLILTEPPFNPHSLQCDMNEVVFEHFQFHEYMRRPAADFAMYEFCHHRGIEQKGLNSAIILDTGFSFSHTTPFIDCTPQHHAIRRVNIGGKLLTNYLKEIVSYRQWNMMDEFWLMNGVKESLCYVSLDYLQELKFSRPSARKSLNSTIPLDPMNGKLKKQYVLPDFHHVMRGYVKGDDEPFDQNEQVLMMETERFSVPELLFHPSDIGIDQAGVAEATGQSVKALESLTHQALAASTIVLIGGNTQIPLFRERYQQDVRQFLPDEFDVEIFQPEKPEWYTWQGASRFSRNALQQGILSSEFMVNRKDYLEGGHDYCNEKFLKKLI